MYDIFDVSLMYTSIISVDVTYLDILEPITRACSPAVGAL